MNPTAKQINNIDCHGKMDNTTALSFFVQIDKILQSNQSVQSSLGDVYNRFSTSLRNFDKAYAQVKRWIQTEMIEELDKQRDQSLRAFLAVIKAMRIAPNAEKREAAKIIDNIVAKYDLDPGNEYMKETTAIAQMVAEMQESEAAGRALNQTGLTEWIADLKGKNEAFLSKMDERTEAQSQQVKGIVRTTRVQAETDYKMLVRAINALAITGAQGGDAIDEFIDTANSEIEHYKRIVAQKKSGRNTLPNSDEPNSKDEAASAKDIE